MPAVSPLELVNAILDAIQESGGSGVYISHHIQTHPRQFIINYMDNSFSLWVYIWTITHGGGRMRAPSEYRIQMTSVVSPLAANHSGFTAIMGYYPALNIFAGFDFRRHQTFTTGSPSIQISIDAIEAALQDGLAFNKKSNDEIAVAIRPDQFIQYILNSERLHQYGSETKILKLLTKAAKKEEIKKEELEVLPTERKRLLNTVARYSRLANFRHQVLRAYDNRCSVTRYQLKLVEAAHILPVPVAESVDHVTNGIALSPTMHRAFDNGLIYLNEDYYMKLNKEKANELKNINLHAGLTKLADLLGKVIYLPADPHQRPNRDFIIEANKFRRIKGYY
ncbi:MAG: HNH endonuclease [Syntrophobacteraceae bacterium]